MNLKKNVGPKDRNIRMAAAGVLVLAGIGLHLWFLSVIGLVLLISGTTGFCLAYVPFKINTNPSGED